MTLLKPSESWAMTADQAAQRRQFGRAAAAELALRTHMEAFARARWPEARICHEMVMGQGRVRADAVAIGTHHIAAFEVKGEYDETVRLLHQVGMYQLCVPEVWMVVARGHEADAKLIRHLLPSVGLLVGAGKSAGYDYDVDWKEFGLTVEAEAQPRPVVPEMMLEMLWADELRGACAATSTSIGKRSTRSSMIAALLDLDLPTIQRAVCAQLRSRDALWRADPPIGRPEKMPSTGESLL